MKSSAFVLALLASGSFSLAETIEADVIVYGATAGGVSAACTATKFGKTAVIAEFGTHVGGLTSGGLGYTDIGNKAAIGGFSREFYKRLGKHYGKAEAWTFAPSVAEKELRALLEENKVTVRFNQRLAGVKEDGARLTEIVMEDGTVYRGKMFVDTTYEGDLMAKAGVRYLLGREANAQFEETLNGIRWTTPKHQFLAAVDPYVQPGDPASGLLPFISPEPIGNPGDGDKAMQAYNFRLCLTKKPENRKPIDPPPGYDPKQYELLGRYLEALVAGKRTPTLRMFLKIDMVTPEKTDINNNGAFSTDYIGMNHRYIEADYTTRAKIWKEHENYIRGLLTFLAKDSRVPEPMRKEMSEWGLCRDEFQDTGGWPHAMYVREGRRMWSDYVMTERVCRGLERPEDAVGLGAYNMDSHNCRRIVRHGKVENEGDVQVGVRPYPISYRSIVPRDGECENLFVPVCLSSTHIAFGSIRMEPVFMILGQSAATAASMAIDGNMPVQKVDYAKLREQLLKDGQILAWNPKAPGQSGGNPGAGEVFAPQKKLEGIVIDESKADLKGAWPQGSFAGQIGGGYLHDGNEEQGAKSAKWTPKIPEAGKYEIILHFTPNPNRATNARVEIAIPGAEPQTHTVDQRAKSGEKSLGVFQLPAGKDVAITLSNTGANGFVIADGVQLLRR